MSSTHTISAASYAYDDRYISLQEHFLCLAGNRHWDHVSFRTLAVNVERTRAAHYHAASLNTQVLCISSTKSTTNLGEIFPKGTLLLRQELGPYCYMTDEGHLQKVV